MAIRVSDFLSSLNVIDFGAIGDGVSDDTAAIDRAFAAAAAGAVTPSGAQMSWSIQQSIIDFPPGVYLYTGAGIVLSGGNVLMRGDPRSVSIKITSDVYFITVSDSVKNIDIRNIHFIGGKGVLNCTNTGANVAGNYVFEDVYFDNYTECAVGNQSNNMPYLKINRCMFMGVNTGGTIGVAWGGYVDLLDISNSAFLNNKYHLKIGGRLSGNICLRNNDFIAFTAGIREADIWVVPNGTDANGTNSGCPITIDDCKFGNENQQVDDTRIIIAREDAASGTSRLNRSHSIVWETGNYYVSGIVLSKNRIVSVSNSVAPFITSYLSNVWRVIYNKDNRIDGGSYTYLVWFAGEVVDEQAYTTRTWEIDIGASRTAIQAFTNGVSNRVVGVMTDKFMAGSAMDGVVIPSTIGDDVSYVPHVLSLDPTSMTLSNSTRATITDARGYANNASTITATAANGLIIQDFLSSRVGGGADPLPNKLNWIEIELKRSAVNPVDRVLIGVKNAVTNMFALSQPVLLPDNWKVIRVPFILPDTSDATRWTFRVDVQGYEAGVETNFDVGRFYVYQCDQPYNTGNLATVGNGSWNGSHMVMGTYHMWIDSTGDLRIKNGVPTGDTDGTVVGTQT